MTDRAPPSAAPPGLDARTEALLRRLVRREADGAIKKMLTRYRPEDIAAAMEHLTWQEQRRLYRAIEDKELAAAVLASLGDGAKREVTRDMSQEAVAALVEHLEPDDATDVVSVLPDELRARVLDELEDDGTGEEVKSLLAWPPESAGGIMSTQVFTMPVGASCGQAIAEIQARHEELPTIYYVYVCDEGRVVGVTSLRDLLTHAPRTPLDKVMVRDPISVSPSTDQEEVARIVARYDLVAVPVVDGDRRLLGIVTVDDVVDVIREEANEDMMLMAGVADPSEGRSLTQQATYRAGFLVATVGAGIVASEIIASFQSTLAKEAALAGFIPVIMGTGGNIGIQSATLAVRGLATGRLKVGGAMPFLWRELRVGALLGLFLSAGVGGFGLVRHGDKPLVGVAIGASILVAIVWASVVGSSLPVLLERAGLDPAVATGPFVTTLSDLFGIVIYFTIASTLLGL